MTDYGIAIAQDDKDMSEGRWRFDSRRPKVTVDIKADPKHLDLLNNFSGGTKWSLAVNQTIEEVLFRIEHKMPFKPKFLCYFYVLNTPVGLAGLIGQYDINRSYMLVNAFPQGSEQIYAKVDSKYFYIIHRADNGTPARTAYGSDFQYRIRYEIMNQRALFDGSQ